MERKAVKIPPTPEASKYILNSYLFSTKESVMSFHTSGNRLVDMFNFF